MLVDGNDERGIDVGIMTKTGFRIRTIRSHVDAEDDVGIVFSRDPSPRRRQFGAFGSGNALKIGPAKSSHSGTRCAGITPALREQSVFVMRRRMCRAIGAVRGW